jgi:hypothetical protein
MTDTTTTTPISVDTIVDRLSFVAWRSDWRARYAIASQDVRDIKRELVRIHADWRRNAPNPGPKSYEYQINSLNEHLPWVRRQANLVMRERRAGTDRRDALLAAAIEAAAPATIAA